MSRAIAILGVGASSGKTVVSVGLLRHLSNRDIRGVPVKSMVVGHGAEDGVGRHCRAARVQPCGWMAPLVLRTGPDDSGELRISTGVLGRARCLSEDTVWLPDLPAHARALAERVVREAARRASSTADVVVIEGCGGVQDVTPDLANTTAALELDANVVLVANARRGGFATGLAGAPAMLPPAMRRRISGYLITNVPAGDGLDTVGRHIEEITGMRMLGTIGHIAGLTRGGPVPAEETLDALGDAVAATDLPDLVPTLNGQPDLAAG